MCWDIFSCLKEQYIDFYLACASERHWGETAACFQTWGCEEQGHSAVLCSLWETEVPTELGGATHVTADREWTRCSENTRRWLIYEVRWFKQLQPCSCSHCAAAIQISYSHFMLQPIRSLRKVPIRKMNQFYTGWLFQMLKYSPEQHTQVFFFLFFLLFFFSKYRRTELFTCRVWHTQNR